ncbi:MAG: hypothetical protein PHE17_17155 [Thiothrix sp.]|uniref:hypothetical protein n=1 Tax=Thiothrix sp. TaxID=1032 RepID=UPI0026364871|nr:hypothetical protein [Thiothrix sp.]MDD5394747.1 hypothetical protein [Thiothrix sp.]
MPPHRKVQPKRQPAKTKTCNAEVLSAPPVPADFAMENRLQTQAAAGYLGIRSETLARWRSERRALGIEQPHFYRIGKRVVYLKSDLNAFLLKRGEASLAVLRAS